MNRLSAVVILALLVGACEEPGPATRVVTDPAYDTTLSQTVQELDAYWSGALQGYEPMPAENLNAYYPGQTPDLGGSCGVEAGTEANNALACDGHIAWDEAWFWKLWQTYGAWAPSYVMAHEWGHYVQGQRGSSYPYDVQAELQADCYAGAYTAATAVDGSPSVDQLVGTILAIRDLSFGRPHDSPDYPWTAPQNHGTGPERTLAFGIGYASASALHCEELGQFERVPRLSLGGGFALDVPNRTDSAQLSDGTQRLTFADRGVETTVDVGYRDFLRQPLDDATIAAFVTQLLGPNHQRIETTTNDFGEATAARVRYQQALDDGRVVHGELIVVVMPQGGGVSIDTYEPGAAPQDPGAWRTVNGFGLVTLLGLVEPV